MKNKLFVVPTIALLLLMAATLTSAQEIKKGQVSVRLKDGVSIVFTSTTEPPVSGRQTVGSIQIGGEDNVMHRAFIDAERGIYFGYDLTVEPADQAGRFKLIFKPLSVSPGKGLQPSRSPRPVGAQGGGSSDANRQTAPLAALALPKYPEPQTLADGDTLALDVLVNPQTGVKIVDLIKVSSYGEQSLQPLQASAAATGSGGSNPTTDFTIESVEMKMTAARLLVNGESVGGNGSLDFLPGVQGALLWFYIPGRGRFVLSLAPREGYEFQKVGTIEGNKIAFDLNGVRYEWVSRSPIVGAAAGSRWNLWVFHDADYRPDFDLTEEFSYQIGAADRVERLLKKKKK